MDENNTEPTIFQLSKEIDDISEQVDELITRKHTLCRKLYLLQKKCEHEWKKDSQIRSKTCVKCRKYKYDN
jgi:hypothetical protein